MSDKDRTTVIEVSGLQWATSKASVEATLSRRPAVRAVDANAVAQNATVTYDPKVGGDLWDFFFDTKTNALSGFRFFHDEAKGDGEFLTLEGEIDCGSGVRLPKTRSWFMNKDRKALGKDTITACSVETP